MNELLKHVSPDVAALNSELFGVHNVCPPTETVSKYNNRITEVDGIKFHSKKEAGRYVELKQLQDAGQIVELELQPQFVLQESFTDNAGMRHRAIIYTADFAYTELPSGDWVVEDVKSSGTRNIKEFRIKWKLMSYKFRDDKRVRLVLVD